MVPVTRELRTIEERRQNKIIGFGETLQEERKQLRKSLWFSIL
jgi:hypothetical protein